jgi:hypothetical protein
MEMKDGNKKKWNKHRPSSPYLCGHQEVNSEPGVAQGSQMTQGWIVLHHCQHFCYFILNILCARLRFLRLTLKQKVMKFKKQSSICPPSTAPSRDLNHTPYFILVTSTNLMAGEIQSHVQHVISRALTLTQAFWLHLHHWEVKEQDLLMPVTVSTAVRQEAWPL